MSFDPSDGLTDELAESIRHELEAGPQDEARELAGVRAGDGGRVELVTYDDDGERADVVVALTREQAQVLAAALLEVTGAPG